MNFTNEYFRLTDFYKKLWLSINEIAPKEDGTKEVLPMRILLYSFGIFVGLVQCTIYNLLAVLFWVIVSPVTHLIPIRNRH